MADRVVVLCSGLTYAGKSHLITQLLADEELKRYADVVRLDDVYRRLFNNRIDHEVTKTEHLYKNEVWRQDMLQRLVLGAAPVVISEAVMLTRRAHQQPFVDMLQRAQAYLEQIAIEKSLPAPTIRFKPLLMFASPETIERRAREDRGRDSAVRGLADASISYLQFEFPEEYEPLYLDTSLETAEANQGRIVEARAFINGGSLPSDNAKRREAAVRAHQAFLQKIAIPI